MRSGVCVFALVFVLMKLKAGEGPTDQLKIALTAVYFMNSMNLLPVSFIHISAAMQATTMHNM